MAKKQKSYKEAILEIEKTIARIETDELDVDSLSKNLEKISALLKVCKAKLRNTEKEVEEILKNIEDE